MGKQQRRRRGSNIQPSNKPERKESPVREIPPPPLEMVRIHTQKREESFSGPLPNPEILATYDKVLPGTAERIIQMAEKEQAHRHAIERDQVDQNGHYLRELVAQSKRGLLCGFIFAILTLGIAAGFFAVGNAIAGGILFGTAMMTVVVAMIKHTQSGSGSKTKE